MMPLSRGSVGQRCLASDCYSEVAKIKKHSMIGYPNLLTSFIMRLGVKMTFEPRIIDFHMRVVEYKGNPCIETRAAYRLSNCRSTKKRTWRYFFTTFDGFLRECSDYENGVSVPSYGSIFVIPELQVELFGQTSYHGTSFRFTPVTVRSLIDDLESCPGENINLWCDKVVDIEESWWRRRFGLLLNIAYLDHPIDMFDQCQDIIFESMQLKLSLDRWNAIYKRLFARGVQGYRKMDFLRIFANNILVVGNQANVGPNGVQVWCDQVQERQRIYNLLRFYGYAERIKFKFMSHPRRIKNYILCRDSSEYQRLDSRVFESLKAAIQEYSFIVDDRTIPETQVKNEPIAPPIPPRPNSTLNTLSTFQNLTIHPPKSPSPPIMPAPVPLFEDLGLEPPVEQDTSQEDDPDVIEIPMQIEVITIEDDDPEDSSPNRSHYRSCPSPKNEF